MEKEEYLQIVNPLVYILGIFILGNYTYEVYSYDKLLAIFIAGSFFALITYKKHISVKIVFTCFFIFILINNYYFYNYEPNENEVVRIISIDSFYGKGEIKGRIVNLSINSKDVYVGDRIYVKGKFTKDITITKGSIGDYKIEEYSLLDDDFITKLYEHRRCVYKAIEEKLGTRNAALISSVSFGYTDEIDDEDREEMQLLGISHVISVSGLHLALVYGILKSFLGIPVSLIITFIYVLFTGASPPTVRAYIMICIMNLAKKVYRNYNSIAALSFAGIIILFLKPYKLFNIGFNLSLFAVLGIVIFNNSLSKKLYKLPKKIREVLAISISAQVFTFPIIIIYYYQFSINFIVGNLIIVPVMNILILLGNILVVIIKIPLIFDYILFLCKYLIRIMDWIIDFCSAFSIDIINVNYTVGYIYISMLITFYFYKKGYKKFILYPFLILVYVVIIVYSPIPKIKYYRDGAMVISYKGEQLAIATSEKLDEDKIKDVSFCNEIISMDKNQKININDEFIVVRENDNYLLKSGNHDYLIRANYDKISKEYDIIDFIKGDYDEVLIYKGKVIAYK